MHGYDTQRESLNVQATRDAYLECTGMTHNTYDSGVRMARGAYPNAAAERAGELNRAY